MKSMEEMIQAAQAAAQTIQKQMEDAQGKLDQIEVEGVAVSAPMLRRQKKCRRCRWRPAFRLASSCRSERALRRYPLQARAGAEVSHPLYKCVTISGRVTGACPFAA